MKKAQAWQAKKADARFAGITWPVRYGGRGGTPLQQIIYNQEEENYVVPRGVFNQGVGLVIPTMMTYATAETLERYARPALRGDEIWCQLFSEPTAGSDLAGLRTARGTRRRRLDHQRPQDLEFQCAFCGLCHSRRTQRSDRRQTCWTDILLS
ncbi:MAG: acyl-CoA dehydrogenase family protein [Rhizomicrobium sp.]